MKAVPFPYCQRSAVSDQQSAISGIAVSKSRESGDRSYKEPSAISNQWDSSQQESGIGVPSYKEPSAISSQKDRSQVSSLWYICGTEDNCLNRDLQDFRIYRIEERAIMHVAFGRVRRRIARLRTGGQPL